MIYFRGRRDGEYIDCSFFVKDGGKLINLENYRRGDEVCIFFDVTPEQAQAINDLCKEGVAARREMYQPKWSVIIPFRVADVRHSLSWREVGTLVTLGSTVFLQAENGHWEDVFKWVCLGEVPPWAEVEEVVAAPARD